MTKTKLTIIAIIAFLLLCVGVKYISGKIIEKKIAEQIHLPVVEAGYAFDTETSSSISSPGRVVAIKSADVIARTTGVILQQNYKEGDIVQKGQLLYTLDSDNQAIALQKARADLENAKAAQFQAQKDYERAAELVKNDYVSKSAFDQALANRNSANARVKSAIAAVNDAKRILSYTKIYAPISGKISLTDITVGNYLSSPNMVLTKIVSQDPIYVTYSLDSGIFTQLKNDEIIPNKNQSGAIKVEVTLPDGTVYDKTGSADFFDNTISQSTGTITLRATFPNPDNVLIPGDFVNVKVYSNKVIKALAVPQTAVLQDSEGKYLYVIDDENVVHKRKITVSGEKDDNWIVTSGITKEEKFVEIGTVGVRDGLKVQIKEKEQKAPLKKEEKPAETAETPAVDTQTKE